MKLKVKTLILSDVHLGTEDCKINEVNHFLKNIDCEKLILNGDIIDGWRLQRNGKWTKEHTHFIRIILKKIEKYNTEVIYLRGNHDDILSNFLPFVFTNLSILENYIHETPKGRYFILHGDVFDKITENLVWLAHLGDWGYTFLLRLNHYYNLFREWRGKEYYSLSKAIKAKVKEAVSHISHFEKHIVQLAREKNCSGIICGHIHSPADKIMDNVHYLNSGDWVESLTAIVEDYEGNFQLVNFSDFKQKYPIKAKDVDKVE